MTINIEHWYIFQNNNADTLMTIYICTTGPDLKTIMQILKQPTISASLVQISKQ